MAEDLLDHWVGLITPIFPGNAWIVSRCSGNDHILHIDWNLGNDSKKRNKRSRQIQITIKEDAIDNYLERNDKSREIFNILLKKSMCERYDRFHPDHDDPEAKSMWIPIEKWLVSKDFLITLTHHDTMYDVS